MRKLLSLFLLVFISIQFSQGQVPQGFNYQAVVRNSSSQPVISQDVSFQINILQGAIDGTVIYSESHLTTTTDMGLVTLKIGEGTTTNDFSSIDWGSNNYFIQVKMDDAGGSNYQLMGTSKLLSVPYALHTKTAESVPVYTIDEISALIPAKGDAVFNSTENLYQIYNGSVWQSFSSNCWPEPTFSNAGGDQTFTDGTVTATLAANTSEAGHGTGAWSIVSGTGGSFADASSPTTNFTGELHGVYTLRWTITTNCGSNADDVIIIFQQDGVGAVITDIDGNTYNTVWIGNQQWMAENLKVTKEANGIAIPLVTDNTLWGNLEDNDTDKAYCYYNSSIDSLAKYGAIYTYAAAKYACPTGWHLSSRAEWIELIDYIAADGHGGAEGTALKATTGWNNNGNGTDDYGFTALPGGYRSGYNGLFGGAGAGGNWWSSEFGSSDAFYRTLTSLSSSIGFNTFSKSNGFSVRCLRD